MHKNTQNPSQTLPGILTYCTLSSVWNRRLLPGFKRNKCFIGQTRGCLFFAQFCTCFGYFWQKIAYFCIPLHNSAQFCIERPKTLPEICKMTVNTPKNWPPKRPKMTQNGSPKCDQNDVKVMPEWPQIDPKTVQKYPKIIPKWPNFDLKIAQLSLGDVDAARKRPGSGQKS